MSYNPTARQGPGSVTSGPITLVDVVSFFRRNLLLIGGTALAGCLIAALTVLVFVPPRYESSATLVIVPPSIPSELRPAALSVQAYQQILESDAVIAEARRRLIERGALDSGNPLRLGQELESRIFVSRRAEETALAPLLQAVAVGTSADQAAAVANTWAEVFLERSRDLVVGSTSSSVRFLEQQYPSAKAELERIENARVEAANKFQLRLDESATHWDEQLTEFKGETSDLVAAQQAETRRLLEESSSELNLETKEARLTSLRTAYGDLQSEQARVRAQLDSKGLELEALRGQVAGTPQFLTLQKAITDDALWQSTSGEKKNAPTWESLQGRSLQTQEVNPVFIDLASRLSRLETEVKALTPRAAQLAERLIEMSDQLQLLAREAGSGRAAIERLTREREAGLARLVDARTNQLNELTRQRERELGEIQRARDTRLSQLDREIDQQRDLFSSLAANYNQALLAKAQQDVEDVRLGASAVAPERPQPRGRVSKALFAAILGGIVGIGLALVRESWGESSAKS